MSKTSNDAASTERRQYFGREWCTIPKWKKEKPSTVVSYVNISKVSNSKEITPSMQMIITN